MDVTLNDQYRIPVDIRCTDPQGQPPSNSTSSLSSSTSMGLPSSVYSGSPSPTSTDGGTPSPTGTGSSSSDSIPLAAVNVLLGLSLVGVQAAVLV